MKKSLLIAALLLGALPSLAATHHALWKLPKNASFQALRLRPDGRVAVYWQEGHDEYKMTTHRGLIDEKSGHLLNKSYLGTISRNPYNPTDVEFETFNTSGQHAYLPHNESGYEDFLRLKIGDSYRVLRDLPTFYYNSFQEGSLQDLKFSPDGEVLKVLGKDRLWIVGAHTGKLLRVIRPQQGKWWSGENAALSPDGFTILGMRDKMTLFSARTGRVLSTYGIYLQSRGGEASIENHLFFSPDGKRTCAFKDNIEGPAATFEYPAMGGALICRSQRPYDMPTSRDGRYYLDYVHKSPKTAAYPVVRSVRNLQILDSFSDAHWSLEYDIPFALSSIFSSDGKSIYWVQDGTLWQRPLNLK